MARKLSLAKANHVQPSLQDLSRDLAAAAGAVMRHPDCPEVACDQLQALFNELFNAASAADPERLNSSNIETMLPICMEIVTECANKSAA